MIINKVKKIYSMKTRIKKLLSIILIVQVLFLNIATIPVMAEDGVLVEEPVAESSTSTTTVETTTTTGPITTTNETETATVQSTDTTTVTPTPQLSAEEAEEAEERAALLERRARSAAAREAYLESLVEEGDPSAVGTNPSSGGAVGTDSTVTTGDANSTGAVVTSGNSNLVGSAGLAGGNSGAQVASSGNGSSSNNSGAITTNNGSATVQDNDADVNSSLNQSATTGGNNNSSNTGGSSTTTTGDANVTGTIITAINTNVDGVMVSEFNVVDNHVGDLVLDFGAGCISGCSGGSTAVTNTGNGSSSTNSGSVDETNNNTTMQANDAIIGNDLTLTADSGNNTSSDNVGGDTSITTGDANVAGNVLNFANTNVAGDVIFAVVNIFGDLIGDILLTEDAINSCCGGSNLSATNTGNGSNSSNDAAIDIENNDTIIQTNDAVIDNNLVLDAQTGNNSTSDNTGGDSSITTGDVDVQASLLNIVNTNLVGGNMWLVLINEAGNWVGKLMGAPEGSVFATSAGSDYTIDENGYITVTNTGNGSDSDNSGEVNQTNNSTAIQTNNANIDNTLNLSANTGGNNANDNTGGNSHITTGDATIIANLVNFVNTNIVGDGKLVVTVVNVFGSWLGDFVTPGHQKETNTTAQAENTHSSTNIGGNNFGSSAQTSTSSTTTSKSNSGSENATSVIATATENTIATIRSFGSSDTESFIKSGEKTEILASVKGTSTENLATNANRTTINLAWLAIIIPTLLVMVRTGRRIARRSAQI